MSQTLAAAPHQFMESSAAEPTPAVRTADKGSAKKRMWGGRVLSGIAVLFLTFDAAMKLFMVPAAVDGTTQLGYPTDVIVTIGLIQVVCLAVYLIPRTAPLGAILWTGYLGGAIATHVRVGSPLLTHTLFPIYIAALIWAGLWLRDSRVRGLLSR